MAPNTTPFSEEQPPPYAKDAHPLNNLRAHAVVEVLPEYTARPPLLDNGNASWISSARRQWLLLLITALLLIVAASVGGVIGTDHYKDQQAAESPENVQILNITALTATECNVGTFVFYQTNTGDIYLYGNLWGAFWNDTNSTVIPTMKLDVGSLPPMLGTNLTAVAYTAVDALMDKDLVILCLFYLSLGSNSTDIAIVEATFTLLYYPPSISPTELRPISQQVVANVGNPTSIAACYIPYWGLGLYYLASPASSGKPNIENATLTQLYWNETVLSTYLGDTQGTPLNATAYESSSALTVACVNDPRVTPEIHVLYMNEDNALAQIRFMNNIWGAASVVASVDDKPPMTGISNMVAIAPYVSPTELYLYYLDGERPQQIIIVIDNTTGLNSMFTAPTSPIDMPDSRQAQPLIAAVTRLDAFGDQPQQSIFYVWTSNSTAGPGEIVNMTTTNQNSWSEDIWEVGTYVDRY